MRDGTVEHLPGEGAAAAIAAIAACGVDRQAGLGRLGLRGVAAAAAD